MKALHARLEAVTASYPYPFLRSGTQLSLPGPPLSSIFGNLSACAGRRVEPPLTVGFEFRSERQLSIDLERTQRLKMDSKTGKLSMNPERGITKRQFHVRPRLDIYLTDLTFAAAFASPEATPCLGRSQDIAWIRFVREIELEEAEGGWLGPTMVPFPVALHAGGRVLPPLADFFSNDHLGHTRRIGRLSRYQFLDEGARVESVEGFRLWRASDRERDDEVLYLHEVRP